MQVVKDSPMAHEWPAHMQGYVLHATLASGGMLLMASDMTGQGGLIKGNSVALSLTCGTATETESFFTGLADGGEVTQPLHDFFAGKIGTLTDRFGIDWLLYYEASNAH